MSGPPRPILLVDTYSLFFRAFHALPEMSTRGGEPTSALYGFCSVLLKELRERSPAGLAFAVDAPKKTFRHERYAEYKATRAAVPGALLAQLGRLPELLDAFGAPVFCAPGFEADDVLATLARELWEGGAPVLVMSGDRDLLQVVRAGVSVLFIGARGREPAVYDVARVRERFGVEPAELPAWVALVGDDSDNLPGTPGVGPRTASKWLRRYGSLDALLERVGELEPARLRETVAAQREQLLRDRELATLRTDAPLPAGSRYGPLTAAAIGRLRALFVDLEFRSLLARLDAVEGTLADSTAPSG